MESVNIEEKIEQLKEEKQQLARDYSNLLLQSLDSDDFKEKSTAIWKRICEVKDELKALQEATIASLKEDEQDDPFCSSEQEEALPIKVEKCNNPDCLCYSCINFSPRKI